MIISVDADTAVAGTDLDMLLENYKYNTTFDPVNASSVLTIQHLFSTGTEEELPRSAEPVVPAQSVFDPDAVSMPRHEMLCRYRGRRCLNFRAYKKCGLKLHALCQMHRDRANSCQRRLVNKRKRMLEPLPLSKKVGLTAEEWNILRQCLGV